MRSPSFAEEVASLKRSFLSSGFGDRAERRNRMNLLSSFLEMLGECQEILGSNPRRDSM